MQRVHGMCSLRSLMLQNACLYDLQPPLLLRRASAASAAVPAPTGWPSVRHAWRQLPIRHHCCSAQRDTTAGAAAAAAAQPPPPSRQAAPGSSSSAAGIGVLMSLATPPQQQLPPLSLQETLSAVAMPATGRNLGARVEHIQVAAAGQLSAVVASALHLPQPFIQELIRFGSVHYCPVMPPPSPKAAPRMSQQHLQHIAVLRAAGKARHGRSSQAETPQRMTIDCRVEEGGYVRVHVHPKRFPAAAAYDWRTRVLVHTPQYVVVDKPPGVQVPPTVDNVLESVISCTAAALGLPPGTLLNPHRLDVGTSGVVLLAKSPAFAAWFAGLFKDKPGRLVKTYRCLSAAPPPVGRMVHWAVLRQRMAGEPAHTRILPPSSVSSGDNGSPGVEGAVRCELVVLQVEQVGLTGSAAEQWGATGYEATLQLVTGRTHQIRAQMAAVGCPLLGDQLYTALARAWQEAQGGQGVVQHQHQREQLAASSSPAAGGAPQHHQHRHAGMQWSKVYQEDPSRPIGLQAARLEVETSGQPGDASGDADAAAERRSSCHAGGEDVAVVEQAAVDEQQQWVEFAAGIPWWRDAGATAAAF